MRYRWIALCCLLVTALLVGVAAAQDGEFVRGEPDLAVHLDDDEVAVGTETTLELDIVNAGDMQVGSAPDERVTTARATTVRADGDGPVEVESGTVAVGSITTSAPATAPLRVRVPADADPGTYDIEVEVRYEYTNAIAPRSGVLQERSETETFDVSVRVPDDARFAVVDVDTDAQTGGDGSLFVTVENVGTETAHDARVGAQSTTDGAIIGEGGAEAFAGTLAPGETTTLEYDTTVTSPGDYAATATVTYEDDDGITQEANPLSFGVSPGDEQTFAVDDVDTTLSVGAAGQITGTVTNEGPEPVTDAVLAVTPNSERIQIRESEFALPELEPGESTTFTYDADVSGEADPGARQLGFVVDYTSGGTPVESDRETARIDVQPRTDEFDLEFDVSLEAGASTVVSVDVTNAREETLEDITANLYANSPLSTGTDESFIDELAPGETATVQFELSAASDAMANTYAVELDFQYTDHRGDDRITDVYQEPVEVTDSSSDGDGSLSPLVVPIGVVLALAFLRHRRR